MKRFALLTRNNKLALCICAAVQCFVYCGSSVHAGDVVYVYDDSGRLKKVTYPDNSTKDYALDPANNRTQVKTALPTGGVLAFVAQNYTVAEGAGTLQLSVARTGATAGAVTVGYAIVAGSAQAGSDYTASNGTLSWAAGNSTPKTIPISIVNDSIPEGVEQLTVYLINPAGGAVLGSILQATVTITDNDAPTISIANATASGVESAVKFTVTLSSASSQSYQVNFATTDGTAVSGGYYSDFTAVASTLIFGPNQTSKVINVPIARDPYYEGNESFTITLSAPTNGALLGAAMATGTIVEDDPSPVFSIASVSVNENAGVRYVTVTKSGDTMLTHAVNYASANGSAVAGSDYSAASGSLTFGWTELTKTIPISLLDDGTYEGNELFTISLSAPTNGATTSGIPGTVTLVDNDPLPPPGSIGFSVLTNSTSETAGSANLTVRRVGTGFGAPPVSVVCYTSATGSAASGSDYTAVWQTITWGAGDYSDKTCTVPVIDDSVFEGNETFDIYLGSPTGGATIDWPNYHALATIVENDPAPPGAPSAPTWSATYTHCIVPSSCEFFTNEFYTNFALTWNAAVGTVTRYEVERDTLYSSPITTFDVGNSTSYYVDFYAIPFFGVGGEAAYFRVRACNGANCGAYSQQIMMVSPGGGTIGGGF